MYPLEYGPDEYGCTFLLEEQLDIDLDEAGGRAIDIARANDLDACGVSDEYYAEEEAFMLTQLGSGTFLVEFEAAGVPVMPGIEWICRGGTSELECEQEIEAGSEMPGEQEQPEMVTRRFVRAMPSSDPPRRSK